MSRSDDLVAEYENIRQDINSIDGQIRELQEHHANLVNARETVLALKNGKGSELLIPAGAGFYFGSLCSSDSFVVNVGANVLIEMSLARAEATLNERIEQALSMIVKFNEDAEVMIKQLRYIEDELQQGQ